MEQCWRKNYTSLHTSEATGYRQEEKNSKKVFKIGLTIVAFFVVLFIVVQIVKMAPTEELTQEQAQKIALNWVNTDSDKMFSEYSSKLSFSSFKTKNEDGKEGFLVTVTYGNEIFHVIVTKGNSDVPSYRDFANPNFDYQHINW